MFQLPSQKILIYPFNWLKTFQFSYFNLFISMLAYAFSSPVNNKNISTWKLKIILSNWKVLLVTPMVEKFEKVYHYLIVLLISSEILRSELMMMMTWKIVSPCVADPKVKIYVCFIINCARFCRLVSSAALSHSFFLF